MLNRLVFLLLVWAQFNLGFSQTHNLLISVLPVYDNSLINLSDSAFYVKDTNRLQIGVLKFYISNICLLKNGNVVHTENNSYHLIDVAKSSSLNISLANKESIHFDEFRFDLGIDSNTNISGVLGGDLDPTKGMYWTWQSGYINFKLEGKSPVCKTRNNEFTFHLGGYQQPFSALQSMTFSIKDKQQINLTLDVAQLISQIDLSKQNHIMSPGAEAVNLSKIVAASFKITESEK